MRGIQEVIERLRSLEPLHLRRPPGSAGAFLVAQLAKAEPPLAPAPILVITADEGSAQAFARDIAFFLDDGGEFGAGVEEFPAADASPYSEVAADPRLEGARLSVLFRVAHGLGPSVLVSSVEALLRRVLPREPFEARCHHVAQGESLQREAFATRLLEAGYERVALVEDPGGMAVRGCVLDIFPQLYRFPVRLEWDGDSVDKICLFDPASQRTLRQLSDVFVHPARETICTGTRLREQVVQAADQAKAPSSKVRELLERLEGRQTFLGIRGYLPALHDHTTTVLDYLPKSALLVLDNPAATEQAAVDLWQHAQEAFLARQSENAIVFAPEEHLSSPDLAARSGLLLDPLDGELDLGARSLDDLAASLRASRGSEDPLGPLRERLTHWRAQNCRVVVQLTSSTQAERLRGLLLAHDLPAPDIQIGELGSGFRLNELAVVAEEEIFGPHVRKVRRSKRATRTDLADLSVGDLVVHAEHGIGRYQGLVALEVAHVRGDFLHLEYAQGHKLYLPITRLSLVERYRGAESVALDRLGGETFARRKRKAAVDAQALAEELLQTYAQRQVVEGTASAPPDALFGEFEATFPFDETPDQLKAIGDVVSDLTASRPMDRLVCGDVGFGKTEVALRAAFLVASDGRQVALLAPTTILVEQHLRTLRERLASWPLRVEGLSRFRSQKEQAKILQDLAAGKVDIAVGTHRLLEADVRFSALGLIIVDEEHRFGVGHKEKLKRLRAAVDVLAMTATPIPRTLHLSLAGLRDLSIISTPPQDRLAVRTLLARTEDSTIRDAIRKELARGGQVFFVHNRVESIGSWAEQLSKLVPEARLAVAHGQLPAPALEKVMLDFVSGAVDVLLTTAIVESGLDIPRANTMLIHRADTLGLAQLYQLRGRIGRGQQRAYCYLLIDSEVIAPDARKRLEAVLRHSDLGSGFALATADLDIRGAGELLGKRQCGHVAALGFETYVRILEDAVAELKGEPIVRASDPDVTVDIPTYIPEDYVEEAGQRLDLYKRLAQAENEDWVQGIVEEMRDRYGPEPSSVEQLAKLMVCKVLARSLGATALDITRSRVAITVGNDSKMDAGQVARLVSRKGSPWRLTPDGRLSRGIPSDEKERLDFARRTLQEVHLCASPPSQLP